MYQPSPFGVFLKKKRQEAQLLQDDLASVIGKSGQYISNIEKGKNNSPPKSTDIEALIQKLELTEVEAKKFRTLAAADRNQLPETQMQYILSHPSLLNLICFGEEHGIENDSWDTMLFNLSGGKIYDIE